MHIYETLLVCKTKTFGYANQFLSSYTASKNLLIEIRFLIGLSSLSELVGLFGYPDYLNPLIRNFRSGLSGLRGSDVDYADRIQIMRIGSGLRGSKQDYCDQIWIIPIESDLSKLRIIYKAFQPKST